MGTFYEKIILSNARDDLRVACGLLDEPRAVTIDAIPDTGAWTLIINEKVRQQLGLNVIGSVESSMADGSTTLHDLTESVEICWKDRRTSQEAVVMPDANDILLGAIPLEAMDLSVDPVNKQLVGVHGDKPVYLAKLTSQRRRFDNDSPDT
jgi:clan AA aspartic protease